MNELTTMTKRIMGTDRKKLPNTILNICRAITPQFYKVKSAEELLCEREAIALLIDGIDNEVLAIMCSLALREYKHARSFNEQSYFDMNYILTFYKKAFNTFWCDSVRLDHTCVLVKSSYDQQSHILTEFWQDNNEKEIIVKCIISRHGDQRYSPKALEMFYSSLTEKETQLKNI